MIIGDATNGRERGGVSDSETPTCAICGGTGIAVIKFAYVDEHNVVHEGNKHVTCHGCTGTGTAKNIQFSTKNHPHVRRESRGKAGERFTCDGCGAATTVPQFWLYVWSDDKQLAKEVDALLTQSLIYRAHFQRAVKPAGETRP